jgi:hypothetical protein
MIYTLLLFPKKIKIKNTPAVIKRVKNIVSIPEKVHKTKPGLNARRATPKKDINPVILKILPAIRNVINKIKNAESMESTRVPVNGSMPVLINTEDIITHRKFV